ncbi:acyl-CoA thioesterase [Microbacterium album]|uniref:Acyl-CoA thioesterase 2 n=1 Tax=Microbacterium album TaxID=2053191 RepID=A0A917MN55_9MICO|nr:acyl-CoA thioesterase II [Microbacterium album]GGH39030.1 acyl-CoA thioesterase II [Microbacterium album]
MTDAAPNPDPVGVLLDVLALGETGARTSEDIFTAASHAMPNGRIFGGQVLGQAVVAAARTLPPDRAPHSLHGYFLRPGDVGKPLTLSVDRIHDGRSFSRRRIQAFQDGEPIFSGIASFQDDDPGLDHQVPMPEVPAPEELPGPDPRMGRRPEAAFAIRDNPIEVRHVGGHIYVAVDDPAPRQAVWTRLRRPIGDDAMLHRAALAYVTDFTIQEPVLRAHGVPWATPGIRTASLDHAIWWHRFGRADEWMLYVQESPSARGGRGLAQGQLYSRDGVLLATVAQEIMLRVPGQG